MALNLSPKIATAKDIATRFDKDQVIILMFDRKQGTLEYASYGATKSRCAGAKHLADIAFDALCKKIAGLTRRPKIVCLCGSTRFMDAFFEAGWEETLKGNIVLSVGVCKHAENHGGEALGPEIAAMLDELHLRKIDLADEVRILNVGGYIGESTAKELQYARKHDKTITFLEEEEKL